MSNMWCYAVILFKVMLLHIQCVPYILTIKAFIFIAPVTRYNTFFVEMTESLKKQLRRGIQDTASS